VKAQNGAIEGRGCLQYPRGLEAQNGPLVVDMHHFDEVQDPDPRQSEKTDPDSASR
jgi:hypothetical protein